MPASLHRLPPDIGEMLLAGRGVLTVGQVERTRLHRLVRAGLLERIASGAYADRAQLAEADPWTAHAIRARGFLLARRVPAFAAGWSAVALRALPGLGDPPRLPVAIQPEPAGTRTRTTRYGVVRQTCLAPEYQVDWAGCPVVHPAWMVVDLATTARRDETLAVADAALRCSGITREDLVRVLAHLRGRSGVAEATWAAEHADGGAESPLETLGRLAFIEGGLPVPLSNVWVGVDRPRYRVDHLLPWHWVAFEGDGMGKYRDAADPVRAFAAEKWRERYLRRQVGLDVVRYDWQQARYDRARLAGVFRAVIAANPVRPAPVRWWPA